MGWSRDWSAATRWALGSKRPEPIGLLERKNARAKSSLSVCSDKISGAKAMKRFGLFYEFWLFLRQNKKLWLVPIVLILLLISGLLIFAQSSALAPFIYSIF